MSRSRRRAGPGSGSRSRGSPPGQLRIIGGRWRGRRLPVADVPGLRPTADRVRETLFNWLQADLPGARCLDLFAGTGALGFEALSRGAAFCDFFDTQRPAIEALRRAADTLGAADIATIHAGDALAFDGRGSTWDVVFLDPPFDADLSNTAIEQLLATGALAPGALLYLEQPAERALAPGEAFDLLRSRRAGAVVYGLYRYADNGTGPPDLTASGP